MQVKRLETKDLSIGLTPLIDVVFILLIFFMLVTNFNGLRLIDLSASNSKKSLPTTDIKPLKVTAFENNRCQFDGQIKECEVIALQIGNKIELAKQSNQKLQIFLHPGEQASLQQVLHVIDVFTTQGLTNILLSE